jgi:phosphoserine phosphatase
LIISDRRRIKGVIFDLDGTLTQERSIWEISIKAREMVRLCRGVSESVLAGEISYEAFCEYDAQVGKGMKMRELEEIVETVPFHPGVDELIHYLKEKD